MFSNNGIRLNNSSTIFKAIFMIGEFDAFARLCTFDLVLYRIVSHRINELILLFDESTPMLSFSYNLTNLNF